MPNPGNHREWFAQKMQSSTQDLHWALQQFPRERLYAISPISAWPPARHAFHLLFYEKWTALPAMRFWVGYTSIPRPPRSESAAWQAGQESEEIESLLEEFDAYRKAQIDLLTEFDQAAWDQEKDTLWGVKSLRWVLSKTYQHSLEHTHQILSMALFWDDALTHRIGR